MHYRKQYRAKHKEKANEYSKTWKQKHKTIIKNNDALKYQKKSANETPEQRTTRLEKGKTQYKKHKEKRLADKKESYSKRNVELHKVKRRDWAFKRYHSCPQHRLANICRKRLSRFINQKSKSVSKSTGCTWLELKIYLESKFYINPKTKKPMTWNLLGKNHSNWQIDHIKPLCSFDLSDPKQFDVACHYTNLQPLWYDDHLVKTKNDLNLYKLEGNIWQI